MQLLFFRHTSYVLSTSSTGGVLVAILSGAFRLIRMKGQKMAVFPKLRPGFRRTMTDEAGTSVAMSSMSTAEKNKKDTASAAVTESNDNEESQVQRPSEDVQRGVQDVEAVTLTWSKTSLILVFLKYVLARARDRSLGGNQLTLLLHSIWLLYFVNAFQSSILSNLLPFVTSSFESHSLLNVIYIVADSIAAAVYIPLSKVLDVWGRAEGFLIMTVFATLGLILMATCKDLTTFCAAYVRLPCHGAANKPQKMLKLMTLGTLGLLHHWFRRHDIHRGRDHGRFIQVEESRPGVRFHILSIYNYGIRWCKSIGRFLLQYQLAMGLRLFRHHLPCRGCSSLLYIENQPSQGRETRHCAQRKERPHVLAEHLVSLRTVRW